jgi:hypothetical protein
MNLDDLPLALTHAQVCEALQIGSTKCWEMIRSSEIAPVIRSGRMVRVPRHVHLSCWAARRFPYLNMQNRWPSRERG